MTRGDQEWNGLPRFTNNIKCQFLAWGLGKKTETSNGKGRKNGIEIGKLGAYGSHFPGKLSN